ncbi:MAG: hypothetical protein KKA42_03450 [candidate division Zixibacteria bacterium]|nr:hypothetical protein [candidate division Zixibacteria bacterium]
MPEMKEQTGNISRGCAWARFIGGALLLTGMALFFASGYAPPGVCGEVLRHNQANDIDASPLLYSEVEHMAELEAGVRLLRTRAGAPAVADSIVALPAR